MRINDYERFVQLGDTHILDTLKNEKYYAPCENELIDLLNYLYEENEQLKNIGVMYQGYNPCANCTYCLENKLCCAEPTPIFCDDAKKNFIQGLCKKHKQIQKSYGRYGDE